MLTARGDVTDRVVGLELGADDYLPKPFEPRELVARIQAVLRRGAQGRPEEPGRAVGALVVDLGDAQRPTREGRSSRSTTAEFELLALFLRHPGRVLSRDRLLDETRGVDWEAYDRSIDVLVSRLRQKLGDDARQPASSSGPSAGRATASSGAAMVERVGLHRSVFARLVAIMAGLDARHARDRRRALLRRRRRGASRRSGSSTTTRASSRRRRRTRRARGELAAGSTSRSRYEGPGGSWSTAPALPSIAEVRAEQAGGRGRSWRRHHVAAAPGGGRYLFAWGHEKRFRAAHDRSSG